MAKVTFKLLPHDDPVFDKPFYVGGAFRSLKAKEPTANKAAPDDDDPVLRIGAEIMKQIHRDPRVMEMRRALKEQFGCPEDEFDRMWAAYTLSLRVIGGKEREWNVDIEGMLREAGVPEEALQRSRTDLATAVFHRILLCIVTDRSAPGTTP